MLGSQELLTRLKPTDPFGRCVLGWDITDPGQDMSTPYFTSLVAERVGADGSGAERSFGCLSLRIPVRTAILFIS